MISEPRRRLRTTGPRSAAPLLAVALLATATGLGIAPVAHANHLSDDSKSSRINNAAGYLTNDMEQQFAWGHGVEMAGAVAGGPAPDAVQVAGEWGGFRDIRLSWDSSIAFERDEVQLGKATDLDSSLFLTGMLETDWLLGIGFTANKHIVNGDVDLEQNSYALDFFGQYSFNEHFSLGGFVNYTYNDLNNRDVIVGGTTVAFAGDAHRYGAGVLATWQQEWAGWIFTATTSVASMNNPNLKDMFDTEYLSWNTLLSGYRPLTDRLGLELYTTYIRLFDTPNNNRRDEEFVNVGAQLDYAVTDSFSVAVGYEETLFYSKFESHRINVGLTWAF